MSAVKVDNTTVKGLHINRANELWEYLQTEALNDAIREDSTEPKRSPSSTNNDQQNRQEECG